MCSIHSLDPWKPVPVVSGARERLSIPYRTMSSTPSLGTFAETKVDGQGRIQERFGGHVCRVIGAIWLFRTLKELYLVQLFARWGSQAITRYVQDSPLRKQAEFASVALQAFSAEQMRHALRIEGCLSTVRIPAPQLLAAVKRVLPALTADQKELWQTMEARLARLEGSVGDEAACVRNLGSPKTAGGCVHRILEGGDFTCCRWKFIERPHVRLSLAVALRLPLAQRCEMCWPPLQASSSSSSSSSSGPASTSRSGSQGESEDDASSESVTGMT